VNKLFCIFIVLSWLVHPSLYAETSQQIKVLQSNENQDGSIDYFQLMLKSALEITKKDFGPYHFKHVDLPYSQERSLYFLNEDGILDVMHTMTNADRESKYRTIKVPLLKGLMGYRIFVTNEENLKLFSNMTSVDELKQLVACQGQHWPDSDILEYNGFKVTRALIFEAMYEMVAKGRCDYFPRGIHEAYPEVATFSKTYPSLRIVSNVMLHYSAPVYFFVGRDNETLATRIDTGLKRLINTGQFEQLMKDYPMISDLYPLEKWQDHKVFKLQNPVQDAKVDNSYIIKLGQQ